MPDEPTAQERIASGHAANAGGAEERRQRKLAGGFRVDARMERLAEVAARDRMALGTSQRIALGHYLAAKDAAAAAQEGDTA